MTEENDTQWHIDAWRTKYEALLQERVAAEQGRWREVASLTHQLEQAVRERDEARHTLHEILAVIHRDGGHYTGNHGIAKSVEDAHAAWAAMMREIDKLRAERRLLRDRLVACLPFVGICPREPDRIQLMRLVRDLAEEVLEEVQ